jgi:hypothetical protein
MAKTLATLAVATALLAGAAPAMADTAVTRTVGSMSDHSAVLRGRVDSSGLSLDVWFQYGKTTAYGSRSAIASVLYLGTIYAKSTVSNLDPSTTYHYRFVVSNLFGTSYGQDVAFTTPAVPVTSSDGSGSSGSDGDGSGSDGGTVGTTLNTATSIVPTNPGNGSSGGSKGGNDQSGDDSADTSSDSSGDDAATTPPAPKPELGHNVVAGASTGTVGVKAPGSSRFAMLAGNAPVPVGSIVDARRGTVQLVTALSGGATQTGTFHGAIFQVKQSAGGGGLTDLVLRGGSFAACKSSAKQAGVMAAGKRKRVVRRLWGNDHHGRFRTRGSNSIATVRGTSWVTTDRCDGTLTSVSKGAVSVRDLHRKKTVLVHAGHSYLARKR